MSWSVFVDLEGPSSARPLDASDPRVEELVEVLDERCAGALSFSSERPRLSVELEADTTSPEEGVVFGVTSVRKALADVGLPSEWDVVAVEAMIDVEKERQLDTPLYPELVGVAEVSSLLGVSKQRVSQLMRASDLFPPPLAELECGPVWDRKLLTVFLSEWNRKPGRPRKESADPGVPVKGSVAHLAVSGFDG